MMDASNQSIEYQWERNNPGLNHKCGTCNKVLSGQKAKGSCFGHHEIPCCRYHKTLFFVGQSHSCEACHHTNEAHEKRHRGIANLVRDLQQLDERAALDAGKIDCSKNIKTRKKPGEIVGEKGNGAAVAKLPELSNIMLTDTGIAEDSIVGGDVFDEGVLREELLYTSNTAKKELSPKATKAENKSIRDREIFREITSRDIKRVEEVLHHPAAEEIMKAECDTIGSKTLTHKLTSTITAISLNNHSILTELNVLPATKNSQKRQKMVDKLKALIDSDLTATRNENIESMKRMGGYWRYVNWHTYNAMVREGTIWDWATGEKLPELEAGRTENGEGNDRNGPDMLDTCESSENNEEKAVREFEGVRDTRHLGRSHHRLHRTSKTSFPLLILEPHEPRSNLLKTNISSSNHQTRAVRELLVELSVNVERKPKSVPKSGMAVDVKPETAWKTGNGSRSLFYKEGNPAQKVIELDTNLQVDEADEAGGWTRVEGRKKGKARR